MFLCIIPIMWMQENIIWHKVLHIIWRDIRTRNAYTLSALAHSPPFSEGANMLRNRFHSYWLVSGISPSEHIVSVTGPFSPEGTTELKWIQERNIIAFICKPSWPQMAQNNLQPTRFSIYDELPLPVIQGNEGTNNCTARCHQQKCDAHHFFSFCNMVEV